MRDDQERLRDILDAINQIEKYSVQRLYTTILILEKIDTKLIKNLAKNLNF